MFCEKDELKTNILIQILLNIQCVTFVTNYNLEKYFRGDFPK